MRLFFILIALSLSSCATDFKKYCADHNGTYIEDEYGNKACWDGKILTVYTNQLKEDNRR